jgi:YafQ family addiction module toxin component
VLTKKFSKLRKKNVAVYVRVINKLNKIVDNPSSYKNLSGSLKGIKRVHIEKSFVLLFKVIKSKKTVEVIDFDHHDKIYK